MDCQNYTTEPAERKKRQRLAEEDEAESLSALHGKDIARRTELAALGIGEGRWEGDTVVVREAGKEAGIFWY